MQKRLNREFEIFSKLNLCKFESLDSKGLKAFTLAEILITIGIIGVVAVLTFPTLISKYQDHQFKTAYKKAFSLASQVVLDLYNNYEFHQSYEGIYNFNLFKSKFKVVKDCSNSNNSECWAKGENACTMSCSGTGTGSGLPVESNPSFIDSSGVAWSLYYVNDAHILVDTNGMKPPNRYGKDRWFLRVSEAISNGKLIPSPDKQGSHDLDCHYPPCYPTSWLYK